MLFNLKFEVWNLLIRSEARLSFSHLAIKTYFLIKRVGSSLVELLPNVIRLFDYQESW
jgi:hypothetical protein